MSLPATAWCRLWVRFALCPTLWRRWRLSYGASVTGLRCRSSSRSRRLMICPCSSRRCSAASVNRLSNCSAASRRCSVASVNRLSMAGTLILSSGSLKFPRSWAAQRVSPVVGFRRPRPLCSGHLFSPRIWCVAGVLFPEWIGTPCTSRSGGRVRNGFAPLRSLRLRLSSSSLLSRLFTSRSRSTLPSCTRAAPPSAGSRSTSASTTTRLRRRSVGSGRGDSGLDCCRAPCSQRLSVPLDRAAAASPPRSLLGWRDKTVAKALPWLFGRSSSA